MELASTWKMRGSCHFTKDLFFCLCRNAPIPLFHYWCRFQKSNLMFEDEYFPGMKSDLNDNSEEKRCNCQGSHQLRSWMHPWKGFLFSSLRYMTDALPLLVKQLKHYKIKNKNTAINVNLTKWFVCSLGGVRILFIFSWFWSGFFFFRCTTDE